MANENKINILDFTLKELTDLLEEYSAPVYTAKQIFNWIYKQFCFDFFTMSNIKKELRNTLNEHFEIKLLQQVENRFSKDGTEKYLFKLVDDNLIETVYIPEKNRGTVCVSTQVGCRFGCSFCQSGKGGFRRNLTVGEIISQYLYLAIKLGREKITNIVFMGIGEPLDNIENVIRAVKIFIDPAGIGLGKRRVCISTCGILPGIERMIQENLGIKISISLHASNDKLRSKLMPINRKYPLNELIKVLKKFAKQQNHPLTFEYILIAKVNTTEQDARQLVKLIKGIPCKLNLIEYNPGGKVKKLSGINKEIDNFIQILKESGIFYTLRRSRGQDIEAACGQLKAGYIKKNKYE